jgi:uncharacterized protein
MDPKIIAASIPGVKELLPIDNEPHAWRAEIKVNIATISGTFGGTIRMTEIDQPHKYRLTVNGEGQQSIINGSALISLRPLPDTKQTQLDWDAEANISGKLASIGQRLIQSTAKMMAGNFFGNVAKQIPENISLTDLDEASIETMPGSTALPNTRTIELPVTKPGGLLQTILNWLRRLLGQAS